VLFGGPRWSETVVENVNHNDQVKSKKHDQQEGEAVGAIAGPISGGKVVVASTLGVPIEVSTVSISEDQINILKTIIDRDDPSIESISQIVASARADLTKLYPDAEVKTIVRNFTFVM
jgi:hypothetical protein